MRLIDADVLMEKIVEYDNQNIQSPNRGTIVDVIDIISEMITEQPTAYDIDKVVAELEEYAKSCEELRDEALGEDANLVLAFRSQEGAFKCAIETVKEGGVSDETSKG